MENEKDFITDLTTAENNTAITEEKYEDLTSCEEVMVRESEKDYLLTNIYDEDQKNHVEKEQIQQVLDESNCDINELFDILGVVYRAYVDFNSYLNIRGLSPRTKEYKIESDKAIVDNSKILGIIIELLKKYNPTEVFNVLNQMHSSELVDFIYDDNMDAFDNYFEQQDVGKRQFVIRMSAFRNEYNDSND